MGSYLGLIKPGTNEWFFFEVLTLLFGQSAAVAVFCRISRALRDLLCVRLWLIVYVYVDDVNQLELEALAESARTRIRSYL